MFEKAEEMGERGIAPLLRYLRDNRIHVDACFGTHVKWDLSAGKVGILYGSVMAGAYFFRVKSMERAAMVLVLIWLTARLNVLLRLPMNFGISYACRCAGGKSDLFFWLCRGVGMSRILFLKS